MAVEEVVRCPFCDEEIRPNAKKCKHCGEWLTDDRPGRPSPVDTEWEVVQTDARDAGMNTAASLFSAVVPGMGNAKLQGVLVAHISSPLGTDTRVVDQFLYDAGAPSIDHLWEIDRKIAQERLDDFLALLGSLGFELMERGSQWYSYRFRRKWDPTNSLVALFDTAAQDQAKPKVRERLPEPPPSEITPPPLKSTVLGVLGMFVVGIIVLVIVGLVFQFL